MSEQHRTRPYETFGMGAPLNAVDKKQDVSRVHDHHEVEESNDHLASIYESPTDQFETVVPFIQQGLERGERCLYVADDNTKEEVLSALRDGGVDVEAARESGALLIHTKADTYLRPGVFKQEEMLDFWQETLAEARDGEGYTGIRAAAEMTWALDEETDLDRLADYEAMLNTIYPGEDYVVLCQYNRERFPEDAISDVIRSHPLVVYDGTVCQNFYYHPPDEFLGTDQPSLDVNRTVEGLVSRARVQHALQEREQYQSELYEITSNPNLSFEEKLDALFDLGCEYFDLEVGGIARVDPAADLFEVETVSGGHDHLVPGAQVALSETYCRSVSDSTETTVGISDPVSSGFDGTKTYEEFGITAYLGTDLELDGHLNRTFFFMSSEPREEPFSEAERTFHHLMGQWIESELKQKQREDHLAALNTLSREIMQAETESEVSEYVVEAARTTLDLPVTAIALYDNEESELQPTVATDSATELLDATSILDRGDGVGWSVFTKSEPHRESVPLDGADATVHPQISEIVVFPLSNYGVLIIGSTASTGFSSSVYDVVETIAANTEAALDQTHRKQQLHNREDTLQEQNETVERLNRVNDIIRNIDQVLVQASTRGEIVQAVCDRLAAADSYQFAWIGAHDAVTNEVTPEVWAGVEDGYLKTVTVATDESEGGQRPVAKAIRTQETQVRNNLATDPPFEPWRRAALDRGFQASIAVPLVYQDSLYGVLTLYSDQPDAFDRMEVAVLTELGETIGYTVNGLERRQALVSEQSVELEFQLRNGDPLLFPFAAEHDCEFEFENIAHPSDGLPRMFFTLRGAATDKVLRFGERSSEIEGVTVVSDHDGGALFEIQLRDSSFFSTLLDRGVMPQTLIAAGEEGSAVIRVPQSSNIRSFVELFDAQYEKVELVGRREVDKPIKTQQEFEAEFLAQLTERQEEILKAAYVAGFFESPREMTAQELAEMLDVTQPTVSRHIRAGERELFELVFGEE